MVKKQLDIFEHIKYLGSLLNGFRDIITKISNQFIDSSLVEDQTDIADSFMVEK